MQGSCKEQHLFNLFQSRLLQVSQFILDDAIERGCGSTCRVICTQPRRISAISVSLIMLLILFGCGMYVEIISLPLVSSRCCFAIGTHAV